jgi:ferredoxin
MGCGGCVAQCPEEAIPLEGEPGKGEPLEIQTLIVRATESKWGQKSRGGGAPKKINQPWQLVGVNQVERLWGLGVEALAGEIARFRLKPPLQNASPTAC